MWPNPPVSTPGLLQPPWREKLPFCREPEAGRSGAVLPPPAPPRHSRPTAESAQRSGADRRDTDLLQPSLAQARLSPQTFQAHEPKPSLFCLKPLERGFHSPRTAPRVRPHSSDLSTPQRTPLGDRTGSSRDAARRRAFLGAGSRGLEADLSPISASGRNSALLCLSSFGKKRPYL